MLFIPHVVRPGCPYPCEKLNLKELICNIGVRYAAELRSLITNLFLSFSNITGHALGILGKRKE